MTENRVLQETLLSALHHLSSRQHSNIFLTEMVGNRYPMRHIDRSLISPQQYGGTELDAGHVGY